MSDRRGLSSTNIATMLKLQDELNKVINPEWVRANYPFLRAAFVEAAEALDHHGWKWWKSQSPDFYQLQIELIDILHFYFSDALVESGADVNVSLGNILREMQETSILFDGVEYRLDELDILQLLELLGAMAACRRRSFSVLDRLMDKCSLSWREAFYQYVSKNVLNLFRQDHGYRDGSYIKIWGGEEDNVWLERISKEINVDDDYPGQLRSKLEEKYLEFMNKAGD
ncbi:dUTP diphosphatase [Pseudomonas aeruginosa]|uniref:dUTP diphosphatase n=1 Tax=Pseudomonas aeruginosa TaxID=287 RepID=UPI0023588590|nr:dUTP diphosphatase [Pseudomonas aeruginosa]MDY1450493.1 dUTP diphosphatase [Pseudomonas aeruginosa]HEJ2935019.1 dUTP diphosphatase [Pseudomonas aeruginosa]